ncbi:MAG: WhiB family transcriptional regulator [Aeromicrobium erythreum]
MSTSKDAAAAVLTTHGVTIAFDHPLPWAPAQEWACAGVDPELFFPADDATLAEAVRVCTTCPLRTTCADQAVARSESGVWGGQLLQDGRVLDRVPTRGRPRKTAA